MSRKLIAVLVTLPIVISVLGLAAGTSSRPTQIVESEGQRSTEFHLFGIIPWPTRTEMDPSLHVSKQVQTYVASMLKLPPDMDLSRAGMAIRILRHSGTEYSLNLQYAGDAKKALALIRSQLKDAHSYTAPSIDNLEGKDKNGNQVFVYHTKSSSSNDFGIQLNDRRPAY